MAISIPRDREEWRVWHEKFVVEERFVSPAIRRRLYILSAALFVLGVVCFFVILHDVLTTEDLSTIDKPIEHWLVKERADAITTVMIALAILFGPIALPIIILVIIVWWAIAAKHAWRPLVLAGAMLLGVILAQLIGHAVGRGRPPIDLMLFGPDVTFSFPSGHVLGACDFLLISAYLISSRKGSPRLTAVLFSVAVLGIFAASVSRIYLGYHWPTDALASLSISVAILGLVIAVDTWRTVRVRGERVTGPLSKPQTEGT